MSETPGGPIPAGGAPVAQILPAAWEALVADGDPALAVRRHLSFLARTARCERLLDALMANFLRVQATEDALELAFRYTGGRSEAVISLHHPYDGETGNAPPSVAEVVRAHEGIGWESRGGGVIGFFGLDGSQNWEPEILEQAAERNAVFLRELEEAALSYQDVEGAFDYGQNWLIRHPVRRNALGEPALYFVSHEDCVAVEVTAAADLTYGQVLLRLMVQSITGEAVLDAIYD